MTLLPWATVSATGRLRASAPRHALLLLIVLRGGVSRLALAAALLTLAALAACGGSGSSSSAPIVEGGPPPIGPIPAAEFATVPPPTYQQVITAFRTVTAANPSLVNNEPALSRALFDEVRRTTTTSAATLAPGADSRASVLSSARRQALFNLNSKMTLEEWKLVIVSPLASARVAPTVEPSAQAAVDAMPCEADIDFADGKADALRHAYWNALMTRRAGAAFAEAFATAHEVGSGNSAAARAMDLHNNRIGRALAERLPAASEAQLLELLLQQVYTHVVAGAAIAPGENGLVFIAEQAKRPFDGRFSGTFNHPASGTGTWALALNLTQCGALIRGNYRATRGTAVAERRFSGSLSGTGHLSLAVADPYPFEAGAADASACLSMQMTLAGNEQALAGGWVSANCPQGGSLGVAR